MRIFNNIRSVVSLAMLALLASCTSMEQISIDYLCPAEFSFAENIRRVGVIAHLDTTGVYAWTDDPLEKDTDLSRASACIVPEAQTVVDSLAQVMADNGFFDDVMVGDFQVVAHDSVQQHAPITREAVAELTELMDVDFIIAVEDMKMDFHKKISVLPEYMVAYGEMTSVVDARLGFYQSLFDRPFYTAASRDTLCWEAYGTTEEMVEAEMDEEELTRQACRLVGESLVMKFLPHWETAERVYFGSGNVNMRNAHVYAQENNWSEARKLWKREYELTKRVKKQMLLSHNIALSYEMEDELESALNWAQKSVEASAKFLSKTREKKEHFSEDDTDLYLKMDVYLSTLMKRIEDRTKLKLQMRGIDANF